MPLCNARFEFQLRAFFSSQHITVEICSPAPLHIVLWRYRIEFAKRALFLTYLQTFCEIIDLLVGVSTVNIAFSEFRI